MGPEYNCGIICQSIITPIYFLTNIVGLILYIIWLIYFISRFLTCRRLKCSIGDNESFEVKYRSKTEYYKYALFITITLIEPLNFIPHAVGYGFELSVGDLNQTTSIRLTTVAITMTLKSFTYVIGLTTVSLINILTLYLIYVQLSYTDFRPIKRKLWKLLGLAVALVMTSFIVVAGALIVQIVCVLLFMYEFCQLVKNSKYLYRLLKSHYQNIIAENYSLYREHKNTATKYKWFTIIFLTATVIFALGYLGEILGSVFKLIVKFSPELHIRTDTAKLYKHVHIGISWSTSILLGVTGFVMLIGFFIVTMHFIIKYKSKVMFSRKTNSKLMDPLLN